MTEAITKKEIQELLGEQTKDIEKRLGEQTKELKKEIDFKLVENNKKIIDSLSEVFVTKTDFDDFKEEYREEFSKVLDPIDKKIGQEIDEVQETTMLAGKVQRHEKWIGQIAKKVDLKLES